jgi:hypothetical protein
MAFETFQDPANTTTGGRFAGFCGAIQRARSGVPIGRIFLYFAASRLLILMVARLSLYVVNKGPYFTPVHSVLDWLIRWDANWYYSIITSGYSYDPSRQCNVNFFPLYPLLVKMAGLGFIDPRAAGCLVSHFFLFVSCVLLWKLTRRNYGSEAMADRAVLFLLFGVASLFFSSLYAESVFLCFALGTFYFATGRRWIAAGACAYFATLTRHVGLLLAAPIAVEYLSVVAANLPKQHGTDRCGNWRAALDRPGAAVTAMLMPALGFATYCAYLWVKFGEPLAYFKTRLQWGTGPLSICVWKAFTSGATRNLQPFYKAWFIGIVVLAVALIVLSFLLRMRRCDQALMILYLLLYLSTGLLEAMPRYLSVVYPFYITLALVTTRWPRLEPPLLAFSASLLTISTVLFVNGYWFT